MVGSDPEAVRPGEELDLPALTAYLSGKVDGATAGITVAQFSKGHSNLTYLLTAGRNEYVLRRGPLGPLPPKAHDMAREFQILEAVHPHFPEAPRVFHLCQDTSVLGAVFFLMERRHGVVLRDSVPGDLAAIDRYPQRISEAFISCLVRMHKIYLPLGKPEGFLQRQVEGWANRWQHSKTHHLPEMDDVIQWLCSHRPESGPPSLVHNDYKLDNVMLPVGDVDRIEAVLDWEMTTVGDPLVDLGLTLCYWSWAQLLQARGQVAPSITAEPGWYSREQFINRYTQLSGRDVSQIGYYEVLGIFKLAVILQQIYFRFRRGQTTDARFADFGDRVHALAHAAVTLAEKNS